MITLRPYQSAASDSIIKAWEEVDSTLLVLPTGGGKTIVFSDVIRRRQPGRTLVLAHRGELIWQARDKIERTTGLSCEIEMANLSATGGDLFRNANVIIGTIQTMIAGCEGRGRMTKFKPEDFDTLIVDEAHHIVSDSYMRVLKYFQQNPKLRILGVTATPDRTDEEALGQVFKSVAFDYEILDAIHDGWLVPVDQQMVNIENLDYSQIRTTAGDLNGADLAEVMEDERNLQGVAGASIDIVGGKRTLIFTASVKQAERLCEIFNRHRQGMAQWVCGTTPPEERQEMLKRFSDGLTQVMINCACLTEGYDNPGVEVVIQAKPTKSRALYSQQVGRATRPLPGVVDGIESGEDRKAAIAASAKPSCLIVDFCGNSGKHKLITSADILGGNVSDLAIERAVAEAKTAGKAVRMSAVLDQAELKIKAEMDAGRKFEEEKRRREADRRSHVVAKAKYTSTQINPFDVFGLQPVKSRGWHDGKKLTPGQRSVLEKANIDPDQYSYADACNLVRATIERWAKDLCSLKQAKVLQKFGYDPKGIGFKQASQMIDALAKNGWKRPAGEPDSAGQLARLETIGQANPDDQVPF